MSAEFPSPQRIRILLNRIGEINIETKEFQIQENPFKVCLSNQPINSGEIFLHHKTTHRNIYPSLVHEIDDVLLYNENDELTEFTIGNLVVEMNGELFTPSASCGLLAGTFREHLLETQQIKERVIRKNELPKCLNIFLINSVRKWVVVKIK
jgi:para-aminobenzoate synthetase/4-amino-4-deoxychorismate lyase